MTEFLPACTAAASGNGAPWPRSLKNMVAGTAATRHTRSASDRSLPVGFEVVAVMRRYNALTNGISIVAFKSARMAARAAAIASHSASTAFRATSIAARATAFTSFASPAIRPSSARCGFSTKCNAKAENGARTCPVAKPWPMPWSEEASWSSAEVAVGSSVTTPAPEPLARLK